MEPFKNNISPQLVGCIADHLEKYLKGFDRSAFVGPILAALNRMELKERAQLIADHLHHVLPDNLSLRYPILEAMLHPCEDATIDRHSDENGIQGWGMFPLGTVVGQNGLEDFERSLLLLKEMTKRGTSEFDVRYFLLADQERALNIMSGWLRDPNVHVRRLVSEGTRPRLPWGFQLPALIADPSPVIPILEALRDDAEEYVRRSVANHMNDIAKDHPDLVANLAKDWTQGANERRKKVVRHACRTLIKNGHKGALHALGYEKPMIQLMRLSIETAVVKMGGALVFKVDLRSESKSSQSLMIDYVVRFMKANGKQAAKVFKWKKFSLGAGEEISMTRSHAIRAITTRKYYDGAHALSIRINGQDFGHAEFELWNTADSSERV